VEMATPKDRPTASWTDQRESVPDPFWASERTFCGDCVSGASSRRNIRTVLVNRTLTSRDSPMFCSEARLAANRRDALKSIGPKTEEGKTRSRANALKHGLCASALVVEVPWAIQDRTEALVTPSSPRTTFAARTSTAQRSPRCGSSVASGRSGGPATWSRSGPSLPRTTPGGLKRKSSVRCWPVAPPRSSRFSAGSPRMRMADGPLGPARPRSRHKPCQSMDLGASCARLRPLRDPPGVPPGASSHLDKFQSGGRPNRRQSGVLERRIVAE